MLELNCQILRRHRYCTQQRIPWFCGELSKTQISDKLRRAACSFVRDEMQHDVRQALIDLGIRSDAFSVDVVITPITTTDPEVITITYHSYMRTHPISRTR
mgnify:CR=1 FL=1